jgi:hypothetical protein
MNLTVGAVFALTRPLQVHYLKLLMRTRRKREFSRGFEALEPRQMLAGNGLAATYFNNLDFTGTTVSRVDATVGFDWKGGSPAPGIGGTTFSVRWTGQVQAATSEAYTFSTVSDDGVRLWVNGKQLVNQWNNHPPRTDRGVITLEAGKRYDVKLEYYQNYGGSVAQLWWNTATIKGAVIPQSQLYSTAVVTPPNTPPDPPPPAQQGSLRISSNGRYLVRADGSPFFYMADTAWQMPTKATREDVDYYLKTRAAQGFNVIQVVALDGTYSKPNRYGQTPLLNSNPATPNDAYFQHLDYIVKQAATYGIYVAIVPSWGRNIANPTTRIFDTTSAYTYGHFLGARYAQSSNVIWINGADWAPTDSTSIAIWRALAQGIGDGDAGIHLMTFHAPGGKSSKSYWTNESWLDFDMIQSGHQRDSAAWNLVSTDYNKSPLMPIIEGEPNYEDIPVGAIDGVITGPLLDAYDVRKKVYWEIFAGAAGTAYGANEVYQFLNAGNNGASLSWQQALSLPGATQMVYLKQLMESRGYLSRVPDQSVITSSTLSGTDHIQATRDANGAYAMIYSGSGKGFTVNMTKITGGNVRASWYDPRTGKTTLIGTYTNTGTRSFTPPTQGYGQDWVLLLDRV